MPEAASYVVTTTSTYLPDLKCEVVYEPTGTSVTTAAPVDNEGDGSSFSPTDLLGASLGTCMLTLMAMAARRHELHIEGMKVRVEKQMTPTPPRRVAQLNCVFTPPAALTDEAIKILRRAAETCPVHQSLHPDVQIILAFEPSDT